MLLTTTVKLKTKFANLVDYQFSLLQNTKEKQKTMPFLVLITSATHAIASGQTVYTCKPYMYRLASLLSVFTIKSIKECTDLNLHTVMHIHTTIVHTHAILYSYKVKLPNSAGHSLVLSSLHLASTNSKQREPFPLYISNTTRYTLRQLLKL